MDRLLADKWLRPRDWRAFSRKLAGSGTPSGGRPQTELKGQSDKDVMALLGWTDLRSLESAYQHADPVTMLAALQSRRELREA